MGAPPASASTRGGCAAEICVGEILGQNPVAVVHSVTHASEESLMLDCAGAVATTNNVRPEKSRGSGLDSSSCQKKPRDHAARSNQSVTRHE